MLLMFSCSKDELSSESIFKEDNYRYTEFDSWLQRNYVEPYNVRFEYRMPDRETSFNYWVSPPNIKESIMIAKLIKFTTLEAMVEMMSSGDETADPALFVKSYFPKVLYLVGSFEISSSGSTALASAENGLQINILGVNFFEYHKDAERIAGTMLHEFTHILDGIHGSPAEFKDITLSDYVGDRYTSLTDDFDYTAHQNSWFYSKTHNAMVYTQALSENSTYIAILFNIDVSHLLPRKHSPFSDFKEICAVTNDEKLYRILKSDGSIALSDAEVLDISRLPKYADGVYKDNSIYSVTDIRQQSLKIVSVQSADYIARQFRQITLFLAIFLAFLMLLCFFAINKVSRWVSYSLETLNEKLRTGALQIDELSSDLK